MPGRKPTQCSTSATAPIAGQEAARRGEELASHLRRARLVEAAALARRADDDAPVGARDDVGAGAAHEVRRRRRRQARAEQLALHRLDGRAYRRREPVRGAAVGAGGEEDVGRAGSRSSAVATPVRRSPSRSARPTRGAVVDADAGREAGLAERRDERARIDLALVARPEAGARLPGEAGLERAAGSRVEELALEALLLLERVERLELGLRVRVERDDERAAEAEREIGARRLLQLGDERRVARVARAAEGTRRRALSPSSLAGASIPAAACDAPPARRRRARARRAHAAPRARRTRGR